jgi:23S rRNA pseudouridine1911/1915/1917 synthase
MPELPAWTVAADDAGTRLDKYLADTSRLGSRSRVSDALAKGKVFVNGSEARSVDAGSKLHTGDVVGVWIDRPGSAHRRHRSIADGEIEILYEDDQLIVIDKPPGLLAVPLAQRREAGSAFDHVSAHLNLRRRKKLLVVHRIDRDTSGLVVFAKTVRAQKQLKDQFLQRRPERVYVALVHGHPRPPEGTWRDELVWDADALLQKRAHPRDPKKKEAVTRYRVLETLGNVSLLEIRLETGKRNQIRIQARLHGHALVGERLYAGRAASQVSIPFGRQALHAYRLSFEHPTSGRMVAVESPLPTDMKELLERLRRQSA